MSWIPNDGSEIDDTIDRLLVEEENKRRRIVFLMSSSHDNLKTRFEEAWARCVAGGYLKDSSLILKRHLSSELPRTVVKALKHVPIDVIIEDLITWYRDSVKEGLISNNLKLSEESVVNLFVSEICHRARYILKF
jgi:hypothetical protein